MAVISESLIMIGYKENILRLQISVNQVKIMQNWSPVLVKLSITFWIILTSNASKQLPSETLYLTAGEGNESVAFEKVKDTLS